MHSILVRRLTVRALTFLTLLLGLAIPAAVSAMPLESGLTSCEQEGCTVVSLWELRDGDTRSLTPTASNRLVGFSECDQSDCATYGR